MVGHATSACKDFQIDEKGDGVSGGEMEEAMVFRGLDVVTNLRGNLLGIASRSRASLRSSGGHRSSERGNEDRSEEPDGGWRSGRSSTGSGIWGHSQFGGLELRVGMIVQLRWKRMRPTPLFL